MFGLSGLFYADVQPHTRELRNSLVVDCLYSAAWSRACCAEPAHTASASNSIRCSDKREKNNGINYRGENNTQPYLYRCLTCRLLSSCFDCATSRFPENAINHCSNE